MRVTSDLLLVGSLPADSTEAAFRAGARHFGDLVFALPDGETGPRAAWVGYERDGLAHRDPAPCLRDAGVRRARGRRRAALGDLAAHRRRDRLLRRVPRAAG